MPEPFDVLAIVAVVALVVVRRFSVFPRPPGAQGRHPAPRERHRREAHGPGAARYAYGPGLAHPPGPSVT